MGANSCGAFHSGGTLWIRVYSELYPAFPEHGQNPPQLYGAGSGYEGASVPVALRGCPPAYFEQDRLHRFNGIRWEALTLEVPAGLARDNLIIIPKALYGGSLARRAYLPRSSVMTARAGAPDDSSAMRFSAFVAYPAQTVAIPSGSSTRDAAPLGFRRILRRVRAS